MPMTGPGGSRSSRVSSPTEGLNVEYFEDNPKGAAGRVQGTSSQRWKESQLQKGALEVYPVCEWGAIERVQSLGRRQDHRARHHGAHRRAHGAQAIPRSTRSPSCAIVPIAVTWHAGTFYAAIEVLEAAGVPFDEIKLVHANDRLEALLERHDRGGGADGAAGEPCRSPQAPQDRRSALARRHRRRRRCRRRNRGQAACAHSTAPIAWLRENEARSRDELLPRSAARAAQGGLMPELVGRQRLPARGVQGKGRLDDGPRLPQQGAEIRRSRSAAATSPRPYPVTAARRQDTEQSPDKAKAPGEDAPGLKATGGKLKMVTKPFLRRQDAINHTITALNSVSRNCAK